MSLVQMTARPKSDYAVQPRPWPVNLEAFLEQRFGERIAVDPALDGLERIESIVKHRVLRRYSDKPVDPELVRLICACGLSSPTKSDLQQRDIVIVENPASRKAIADLIPDMPWIGKAPCFLVFLANGRRLPALSRLARQGVRQRPFRFAVQRGDRRRAWRFRPAS